VGFRPNWYENEKQGRRMSWSGPSHWTGVGWLLALIGVGFLLQIITDNRILLYGGLRAWWIDPESGELVFNLGFPFQLVTYAFFHSGFWHIFGNCLFLWIFGPELEASYGKRGFLRLFFGGAVLGGLLQWVYWVYTNHYGFVFGASGGVFALLVLYALKWPRRTIYLNFLFPIPVWVLAGGYVLLNVVQFIQGSAVGTSVLAHMGGAVFALLWWRRGDVVGQIAVQRKRVKADREAKETSTDRREMDRILAKIQASGLSSLDTRERSFLERRSRELREGRG
jgi:membrane associated rhomboid family serine protease